jgi:FkbM family methyltransferase
MFRFSKIREVPLSVVDVGAASMGEGTDSYAALAADPGVRVVGFEPNADACAARNAAAPAHHRFLPYFIGDGTRRTFHLCANPLTSSLYRPNERLLSLFHNLPLPVVGEEKVDTRRLDDLDMIEGCDFLKIDVQGAELDVLKGARQRLASCLVVHTEVEFVEMYEGQALFGDIDVFLRGEGMMFHRLVAPFSRQLKPLVFGSGPFGPGSQLLFAEAAVYVRAFDRLDGLGDERLLAYARLMHDVYASHDLVALLLQEYDRRTGGGLLARYAAALLADSASPGVN